MVHADIPPATPDERWAVVALDPRYLVSTEGRVFRPSTERLLKPTVVGRGYCRVSLAGRQHYVHRLVLEAFVGPCPVGEETLHANDRKGDNRLANLAWGSRKTNRADARRNGRRGGRLSHAVVSFIKRDLADGWSRRDVARLYGVSPWSVSLIERGKTNAKVRARPKAHPERLVVSVAEHFFSTGGLRDVSRALGCSWAEAWQLLGRPELV